ncbi:MAG: hypothetical protein H9Q65_04620 [Spiroplasma ixodetis]|nr:hypothetical protein [Spiroplasma ixodetis]MBP1527284.1 hypothetical protein [Spiroplasma ixodetis]MBP1528506.1 hypothetical protein [Spiroplasma ixodetis]
MKKNNFIYARYDKEDNCLGVYDTMEEAILKIYHIDKTNKKRYYQAYNNIYRSYQKYKNNFGNVVCYEGFWFKIPLNENGY